MRQRGYFKNQGPIILSGEGQLGLQGSGHGRNSCSLPPCFKSILTQVESILLTSVTPRSSSGGCCHCLPIRMSLAVGRGACVAVVCEVVCCVEVGPGLWERDGMAFWWAEIGMVGWMCGIGLGINFWVGGWGWMVWCQYYGKQVVIVWVCAVKR